MTHDYELKQDGNIWRLYKNGRSQKIFLSYEGAINYINRLQNWAALGISYA